MPKRGTGTEPTALHLLGGGGNPKVPAPAEPPQWLSPEALDIWRDLAPHVTPGTLTPATAHAFAMLVTALATYADSDQLIQASGILIAEGQSLAPNPALAIRIQADATYARWAKPFGLLPDPHAAPAGDEKPRGLRHLVEGG